MNTQQFTAVLKKIRETQGSSVFLNEDRLSSYLLDLSENHYANEAAALIKAGYRLAKPEITALIRTLETPGNDSGTSAASEKVKASLTASFFPAKDCRDLLTMLLGAFDRDFDRVDSGRFPMAPAVDISRLSAALQALDDRYQDELWKSGPVLASLLSDQDRSLVTERHLVELVYEAAGTEVRKLVSLIVKGKDETSQTILLQKKLRDAFLDDSYIDAFLEAVLHLFGKEYKTPLRKRTAPPKGNTAQTAASPSAGRTVQTGSGSSAGKTAQAGSGSSPGKTAQAGSGSSAGKTAQAGSASSAGKTAQTGTAASPAGKKRGKKKFVLLLAAVLLIWFVPRFFGGSDGEADGQAAGDPAGAVSENSPSDDPDTADEDTADGSDTGGESETSEPAEPELYFPKTESEITLDTVDATVYGDNVTDLHNYSRYQARGKNFTFAYPRNLYTNVELVNDTFDTAYVFTGTDGSYLEYHIKSMTSKYASLEWRETLTGSLTSGMTDVQLLAYTDGDDEGHFYLTAKEGGLNVVIVSTLYVSGGPAEWMILKYPAPTDDQDALRKAYLAESLYCLAGFSDSSEQGLSLRTFEDFAGGN